MTPALRLCAWCICLRLVTGIPHRNFPNLEEEIREWRKRGLPERAAFVHNKNTTIEADLLRMPAPWSSPVTTKDTSSIVQDNIIYYMFTRQTRKSGITFTKSIDQVRYTGFDARRPTKVVVHGFSNNISSEMYTIIVPKEGLQSDTEYSVDPVRAKRSSKHAAALIKLLAVDTQCSGLKWRKGLLDVGDFNVIGMDWGALAVDPFYITARTYVQPVGEDLAAMLDFLAEHFGLRSADLHLMGHSLGAHVVGTCGKSLKAGRVARISGMDPALPLFVNTDVDRLSNTDADVVDVIHTTAGLLGMEDPVGTVDFYPNGGGNPQPGCGLDLVGACSHSRAYLFFAESISEEGAFAATPCSSAAFARKGWCWGSPGSRPANMGYRLSFTRAGSYYLKTESSSPYDVTYHSKIHKKHGSQLI